MLALHRSAAAARLESQSRKPKPVLAPQQKASLHVQAALASSCQSHHYTERTRGHTEEHGVRQPIAVTINREHFKKISTCLKAAVCPSSDKDVVQPWGTAKRGLMGTANCKIKEGGAGRAQRKTVEQLHPSAQFLLATGVGIEGKQKKYFMLIICASSRMQPQETMMALTGRQAWM